jgi:5-methylthioribose kinase
MASDHGEEPATEAVTEYLITRGHLRPDERAQVTVTRLTGGVSAETLLVESPASRLVVKRALSRLLVAGDWTAKPERAMTEAAAIEALHAITPDHAPRLLDADPATNTLVIQAAPADWANWKTVLLGQCLDPSAGPASTAAVLGEVLGTWHATTRDDPKLTERFADREACEQLRVDPFYRQIAASHPATADRVMACVNQLEDTAQSLVHGDYSPKNVLVGTDGVLVLDYEVAHLGAPVFDVAFMQTHLLLKAAHMPQMRQTLATASSEFLRAYQRQTGDKLDTLLAAHVATLLLARVDGVSPAGYLTPETAATVRSQALRLLTSPDQGIEQDIEHIWATVPQEAG